MHFIAALVLVTVWFRALCEEMACHFFGVKWLCTSCIWFMIFRRLSSFCAPQRYVKGVLTSWGRGLFLSGNMSTAREEASVEKTSKTVI